MWATVVARLLRVKYSNATMCRVTLDVTLLCAYRAVSAKHDSLTIQAGEYVQRIQSLQREMTAAEETLKAARAEVREARDAARREADTAAAEITKLTADLADARAAGHGDAAAARTVPAGTTRNVGAMDTATAIEDRWPAGSGAAGTSAADADGTCAAEDAGVPPR